MVKLQKTSQINLTKLAHSWLYFTMMRSSKATQDTQPNKTRTGLFGRKLEAEATTHHAAAAAAASPAFFWEESVS